MAEPEIFPISTRFNGNFCHGGRRVPRPTDRTKLSLFCQIGVSVLALVDAVLWSAAAQAAYAYNVSQVSPVALTMPQIAAILDQTAAQKPYLDLDPANDNGRGQRCGCELGAPQSGANR